MANKSKSDNKVINIAQISVFAILGAALGYFVFPYVVPYPFSHKIAWLSSPPTLSVFGTLLGLIFGFRILFSTSIIFLGGFVGALLGQLLGPIVSIIVSLIWYDFIKLNWPRDHFLFLDSIEMLSWALLTITGAITGWLLIRILSKRKSDFKS